MSTLHQIHVNLSNGQKQKLARAYKNNEQVSIRLGKNSLSGSGVLMVPKNRVKKIQKAAKESKGLQINITKSNIRKQTGEGIFTSLIPVLRNVAPTIGKTLGLSALAGLASEGASQIVKKITGGHVFQAPNQHLSYLAAMSDN